MSWVRVPHLAPCLVKNGKMAVEDVEEPADDVLVRAVSDILSKKIVNSSKNILVLREPGHRHGWVVSDQLKQRGAEPHEHVVHLGRKVKNYVKFLNHIWLGLGHIVRRIFACICANTLTSALKKLDFSQL